MILFVKNIMTDKETQYILHDAEDFEEIFHDYPKTRNLALRSRGLQDAAEKIAQYIGGSSRLDAWIEGDSMSKSLKTAAAVVGLAMPASAGGRVLEQAPKYDMQATEPDTGYAKFGEAPEDSFLWTIMQIESSGGKNFAHPKVKQGPLKGEIALGKWGLMKPTIKEILDRMKMQGKMTAELQPLYTMDRSEMVKHFENNPGIELKLARILAHHVLTRQHGDLKRAAYSWDHGHNLKPENISDQQLGESDYIQKFKSFHQVNPFKKKLHKAETPKKESASDFSLRLNAWSNMRTAQVREPLAHTSSFRPDPGRLRDPELDEVPKKGIRGALEWAIKLGQKGHKKS
jgi:hypothetical protein